MKNVIAFAPRYNTPGKSDATGAFIPEARRFVRFHEEPAGNVVLVDNRRSPDAMRAAVLRALEGVDAGSLDGVAFFCHGSKRGLQLGFGLGTAGDLATVIARAGGRDVRVPLYACDTGRDLDVDRLDDLEAFGGDGGFADALRVALGIAGAYSCIVDAHTSAGHAVRNPNVRRFEGPGYATGPEREGYYLIPHGSPLWGKWQRALRSDFRFEYPFLSQAEIEKRLA